MQLPPTLKYSKNKITYQYDINLDPLVIDCSIDSYHELVNSGQLMNFVNGFLPKDIVSHKKNELRNLSYLNPGCALVYIDENDFITYPSLIDILLPLVKDKRVKLIYNPIALYDKFVYVNSKSFRYFSENARYRIEDLGGDLTITNKAILATYLTHTYEKNENIKQLQYIVPLNKDQAVEFINKHKTVMLTPLFDYCKSYTEIVIRSESNIVIPYSNNDSWEEYLYDSTTDKKCPFMLREFVVGEVFIVVGSVVHSLDLSRNTINFISCPEVLKPAITEIIIGTGISATFFSLSVIVKNGVVYPTNIDLRIPNDYLGTGKLSIGDCTREFANVFNVGLPY